MIKMKWSNISHRTRSMNIAIPWLQKELLYYWVQWLGYDKHIFSAYTCIYFCIYLCIFLFMYIFLLIYMHVPISYLHFSWNVIYHIFPNCVPASNKKRQFEAIYQTYFCRNWVCWAQIKTLIFLKLEASSTIQGL